MKKLFLYAACLATLASCMDTDLVDNSAGNAGKDGPISFVMQSKNITRSYSNLQDADHYNFGVFAYKSTDLVNPVMPNYLVGYYDDAKAYQKTGTTVDDQEGLVDGKSYWMYEGMGYEEYKGTYAGAALDSKYASNNKNQYLKFWDNAAATTAFYAYAPYINGTNTVTYVDGTAQSATGNDTYVMCFPNGSIEAGMDNPSLSEYMYAYNKVAKSNYGHDVALQFHRLNAKVNIKFWEDVPGYKVRILDLSSSHKGVQAAASIKEAGQGDFGYRGGKFYKKNGVKINFATTPETMKQFVGTSQTNSEPLVFAAPTDAQIGENRYEASASASTYYAIPKGQGAALLAGTSTDFSNAGAAEDTDFGKTGFTFHVTYELTAEDTGEKIVVNNATVHVPCDYANWKPNTHYTYIFKITKNSNGTTEDPTQPGGPTIDPTDPEVPTTQALYPIVFDNCTVVDWDEVEGEWNISDGNEVVYHDVQLFSDAAKTTTLYSLVSGDIYVDVTDKDTYKNHEIKWNAITLAGPAGADMTKVTYSSTDKKITVAPGAAAGVYTVTYTCPATYDQTTHPSTWTETFVVGNEYTITTHRDVIGTNSDVTEAKLNVTGTITTAGGTAALSIDAANLSIDYPANFTTAQKENVTISGTDVVVKKAATPGVYKVVYSIADPVDGTKKIKVAEHKFTVVDYNLTLSHTTVFNTVGGTTVTANKSADADHVYTVSGPDATNVTVTSGTNKVVVANNATEGTYTVTYTIFGSAADKTVYTKTFDVKNTYAVTLSTSTIDYDKDWDGGASTYGSEFITVTPWVNGVAKTSGTSTLAVKQGTDDKTSLFTLTDNGNGTYKLQVKPQTAVTGNYTVEFTENGVTSKVDFVVTH